MKFIAIMLLVFINAISAAFGSTLISSLGDTSVPTFTINNTFTTFTTTLNSASTSISGNAADILSGEFSTIDLTGYSELSLEGTSSDTTITNLIILLFDASDNSATFSGGTWQDIRTNGSTTFVFDSSDPGFSFSSIYAVDINFAGDSADSISGSLSNLSAVPEPSSALLLGLGAAGLYLLRRRRAKSA